MAPQDFWERPKNHDAGMLELVVDNNPAERAASSWHRMEKLAFCRGRHRCGNSGRRDNLTSANIASIHAGADETVTALTDGGIAELKDNFREARMSTRT